MIESKGISDDRLTVAADTLRSLAARMDASVFEKQVAETCASALDMMVSDSGTAVELPYFKDSYSTEFKGTVEYIINSREIELPRLHWLAFYVYAYMQELFHRTSNVSRVAQLIHAFFDEHYLDFPIDMRMHFKYLREKFGADLFRQDVRLLTERLEAGFQAQQAAIAEPVGKVVGYEKTLAEWDKRVVDIQTSLKGHAEKLNFVGLSQAFSQQASKKTWEKRLHAALLTVSGVVLLLLPFFLLFFGDRVGVEQTWDVESLPRIIPFAVSELILLYIFRIFLRNYMSAKTQLVQLELRTSLCAFVQNYAEFVRPLRKEGDPKVLERFEALIFSAIISDPKDVPSHLDGLPGAVHALKEVWASKAR